MFAFLEFYFVINHKRLLVRQHITSINKCKFGEYEGFTVGEGTHLQRIYEMCTYLLQIVNHKLDIINV